MMSLDVMALVKLSCVQHLQEQVLSLVVPCVPFLKCLGVQDVVAKSIGTSNAYNMIRATFDALKREDSPRQLRRVVVSKSAILLVVVVMASAKLQHLKRVRNCLAIGSWIAGTKKEKNAWQARKPSRLCRPVAHSASQRSKTIP